tara:strand:- start:24 stop:788 length:765 start_codon:yes stop_codon:yes gene_type:complete
MNFFYFLKHIDTNLYSTIDLFNNPPMKRFYNNKLENRLIRVFYSENNKWNFYDYGFLEPNKNITINSIDIINKLGNNSFFIALIKKENTIFDIDDYMLSQPTWRSNIAIRSTNTSSSYQGEIPSHFLHNKISLVSCSPMIQNIDKTQNFFYLVNLFKNPVKEKFIVEVFDRNKVLIKKLDCYTNTINCHEITDISRGHELLIFKSNNHGGIPLYFTKSEDNKYLSLEHTHPPVEYVYSGNRLQIQKNKKKFWFK